MSSANGIAEPIVLPPGVTPDDARRAYHAAAPTTRDAVGADPDRDARLKLAAGVVAGAIREGARDLALARALEAAAATFDLVPLAWREGDYLLAEGQRLERKQREDALRTAEPAIEEPEPAPFHGLRATVPPAEWLVGGLIETAGQTVVGASPGHGKTTLAAGVALAVAAGREWFGQAVRQGAVVWLAGEDAAGAERRCIAAARELGLDPTAVPVLLAPAVPQALDPEDVDRWAGWFRALDPRPVLVVVDPWAEALPAGDSENSSGDTLAALRALRRIVGPDCAILLLAHPRKADDELRGSGALRGRAFTVAHLKLTGDLPGARLEVRLTKNRNGSTAWRLDLRADLLDGTPVLRAGAPNPTGDDLGPKAAEALAVLASATGGLRFGEWRGAARQSKTTFLRTLEELRNAGAIVQAGDRYCAGSAGWVQGPPLRGVDPVDPSTQGPRTHDGPTMDLGPTDERGDE